ncbi:MAG TPA: hypothetical protein VGX25_24360 [Actinophytocola sp.]|uniref:hypothetical protein n=1 Tax=Actinophytocola sp. TaxID=1872138 RepID=UPI002DDCCFA6|nr:hypothetical protein [Actinophytocola sp.]HEV2782539.1 hypothetical protein [Actinophytocola sp.]
MKDRLLADLDDRIARHAGGDPSGVLEERALDVVAELAASGDPDAGSLSRVAALHLCRYQALRPEHGEADLHLATALYTRLHAVDPRLVPAGVRDFLGLASPYDAGVALLGEYDRTGRIDHLERAISLFRQEVLTGPPDHADALFNLAMALLCRFEQAGEPSDVDEAVELGRAALAATPAAHPLRAERSAWLDTARRLQVQVEH